MRKVKTDLLCRLLAASVNFAFVWATALQADLSFRNSYGGAQLLCTLSTIDDTRPIRVIQL